MDYQRTWCQLLLGPHPKTDMQNQWAFWWAGRVVTCLKSLHTNIYICGDMRVSLFGWVYPQYAHIIPIIDPVTNYWDPTKGWSPAAAFLWKKAFYLGWRACSHVQEQTLALPPVLGGVDVQMVILPHQKDEKDTYENVVPMFAPRVIGNSNIPQCRRHNNEPKSVVSMFVPRVIGNSVNPQCRRYNNGPK